MKLKYFCEEHKIQELENRIAFRWLDMKSI